MALPRASLVGVETKEVVMMAIVIVVVALAISVIGGAWIGPTKPHFDLGYPWTHN